jgi:hypothetical protein
MSGLLVNLIIQLVAGAVGGNAVGAAARNANLGALANSIVVPLVVVRVDNC